MLRKVRSVPLRSGASVRLGCKNCSARDLSILQNVTSDVAAARGRHPLRMWSWQYKRVQEQPKAPHAASVEVPSAPFPDWLQAEPGGGTSSSHRERYDLYGDACVPRRKPCVLAMLITRRLVEVGLCG